MILLALDGPEARKQGDRLHAGAECVPAGREGHVMPTIKGVDVLDRHCLNRPCDPVGPNKGPFVQGIGYARGCRSLFPAGSFCD
jgi:hypothetical protein